MRILDKYILKEFLAPFLFGVAAFTAIFLGADTLLKIASYVTKYGASSESALKIFIRAPENCRLHIPDGCPFRRPYVFLSPVWIERTDCHAFFRAGFLRLATPVFFLSLAISICAVAFNEYVVPWTNSSTSTY